MNRALFIDRDGIFHELVPWGEDGALCAPRFSEEVVPYADIEGIHRIKELGFRLVLVTNQPDIERGITAKKFVDELNERYRAAHQLDAVYCCPFSSDKHPMKKPNPGMFLQASRDLDLSLEDSYHLGDTERDVDGAKRAGIKSILWDRPYNRELSSDYRVKNIFELHQLLSHRIMDK